MKPKSSATHHNCLNLFCPSKYLFEKYIAVAAIEMETYESATKIIIFLSGYMLAYK